MKQQTERQQDITTLQVAFEQYFAGVEPPAIKHLCTWLYRMSVENILAIMERVAAIDAEKRFNSPIGVIWRMIQNESVSTGEAVRFDAEGQRL